MKIVILGSNGQLGSALTEKLSHYYKLFAFNKQDLDITNSKKLELTLNSILPDIIINAAAYTLVDSAEQNKDFAYEVNAHAVGVLSKISRDLNCWLIHFSTDYVFDGKKKYPYLETDKTNPINTYGKSKLEGEKSILNTTNKFFIFRSSWVMGIHGKNFIKSILKFSKIKKDLKVVNDQIGVPTTTNLITKVVGKAIFSIDKNSPWETGIYHLTPNGRTNWYDIAQHIVKIAHKSDSKRHIKLESLMPIKTFEYPTSAERPLFSLLNNNKISKKLDFELPNWKHDFIFCVKSIIKNYDL